METTPKEWSYETSVEQMKAIVHKWKNLTVEMLTELWEARAKPPSKWKHTDITSRQKTRSWDTYCEEIGITSQIANRWLAYYDPDQKKLNEVTLPKLIEPTLTWSTATVKQLVDAMVEGRLNEINFKNFDDLHMYHLFTLGVLELKVEYTLDKPRDVALQTLRECSEEARKLAEQSMKLHLAALHKIGELSQEEDRED